MSRHFTFTPHQHDVPVEVVEVLAERAREYSLPMVLIGAAARDLCVGQRPGICASVSGRGEAFTAQRGRAVIEVLDDPASASLLALQMKKPTSADLLDAYRRGFISGCPR